MTIIRPFTLAIPDDVIRDLNERLDNTRWAEQETVDDQSQGAPLARMLDLSDYWRNKYDWRRCERNLNQLGQFKATIDGLDIHFLHIKSPEPEALPMVLTHGWPGSVIEFLKVIDPLVDPAANGGASADAFDLVIPSLPGFGFSERPARTGWGLDRIARAWITLMEQLDYSYYVAQGGDWGAGVTTHIGTIAPPACRAIHLNMPIAFPTDEDAANADMLSDEERDGLNAMEAYRVDGSGYALIQATRPQTLGYSLVDSPIGQAAWIVEKLTEWSDCDGDPLNAFTMDEILDNIMLYWLPATGASAGRIYRESIMTMYETQPVFVPTGCSLFPKEIFRPSRRWAERRYPNIIHWNRLERGGHFAAFEQPSLFVQEMRDCFRSYR